MQNHAIYCDMMYDFIWTNLLYYIIWIMWCGAWKADWTVWYDFNSNIIAIMIWRMSYHHCNLISIIIIIQFILPLTFDVHSLSFLSLPPLLISNMCYFIISNFQSLCLVILFQGPITVYIPSNNCCNISW